MKFKESRSIEPFIEKDQWTTSFWSIRNLFKKIENIFGVSKRTDALIEDPINFTTFEIYYVFPSISPLQKIREKCWARLLMRKINLIKLRRVETSESTELNFINVFSEAYRSRERTKPKISCAAQFESINFGAKVFLAAASLLAQYKQKRNPRKSVCVHENFPTDAAAWVVFSRRFHRAAVKGSIKSCC